MGRERDKLEDEGTWHQPLRGRGVPGPQDQPTAHDTRPEDDARTSQRPRPQPPGATGVDRTSRAAARSPPRALPPRDRFRRRRPPRAVPAADATTSRTKGPGTSRWWRRGVPGRRTSRRRATRCPRTTTSRRRRRPRSPTSSGRPRPATSRSPSGPRPAGHLRERSPPHRAPEPRRLRRVGRPAGAGPPGGPGRLRQVPPHREDRRGRHGRGLARLARQPRDRARLKLIKPELAQNDKGWRRFQREARLMAKINHPNAVAVYDFGRSPVGRLHRDGVRPRPQPHRRPQGQRRQADVRGVDRPDPRPALRGAPGGARPHRREDRQAPADHPPRPQAVQPDARRAQGRHRAAEAQGAGLRHRQDRRGRGLRRADRRRRPGRHPGLHEPRADPRRVREGRHVPRHRRAERPLLRPG